MTEAKKTLPIWAQSILWGSLWGSVGCVVLFLILMAFGANPMGNLKTISILPCFFAVFFALKKFKKEYPTTSQKVMTLYFFGLVVNFGIGIITGLIVYFTLTIFGKSLIEQHILELQSFIQANPAYDAPTKQRLLMDIKQTSALDLGMDETLKRVASGFIYVLLAAALVRR